MSKFNSVTPEYCFCHVAHSMLHQEKKKNKWELSIEYGQHTGRRSRAENRDGSAGRFEQRLCG